MRLLVKLLAAFALAVLIAAPARADFSFTSTGAATGFDFTCFTSKHCFASVPIDANGAALPTAPGTGNTSFALPIQGVPGGVAVPVSGTFWQSTQPVSGTFWPYSLGQQVAGSSVPVVLTAAQITTLTPIAWSNSNQIGNTAFGLNAGSQIIGKVGIDQTTPGTTNGVQINAALPAGTNKIGTVDPATSANWGLGAFGSAMPTNGQGIGLYDGTNMVRAKGDETSGIWVNIKAGAGSGGTAIADNAAFTQSTTSETPMGCLATGTYVNATANHSTIVSCTLAGSVHTTVDNANPNGSAVSASSSPVVIASDQAAVAVKAASASIASGAFASGSIGSGAAVSGAFVAGAIADLAHGQGTAAASVPVVLASNQTAADPCMFQAKTNVTIATSSGTTQVVAPSGSTQVYVCSFSLIAAAAAVVNLVGGTGATCTTGTPVAALGSTTAANGMSLAANGGLTFGNGGGSTVRTTTAGHGLCLIQSGTTALAGNLTYVQQ